MTEEKPASVAEECFPSPQHPVVLNFLGDQSQFVDPTHIAPGTIVPARGKNPARLLFELVPHLNPSFVGTDLYSGLEEI